MADVWNDSAYFPLLCYMDKKTETSESAMSPLEIFFVFFEAKKKSPKKELS